MLRRLLIAMATVAACSGSILSVAQAQTPFRPVAVVNDDAITGYDLAQRAQIMVILGVPTTDPELLRAQALDQLVQDRLKIQAGKAIGIVASEESYQQGLAAFAEQAGMSAEAFAAQMTSRGVSEQALRDFVNAEVIWRNVVQARFASRFDVAEAEIDAEIALVSQGSNSSYRLLEIGLPMADDGRTEAETRALAARLYQELSAGGDFTAAARRYSRAPSAANGGDVGWINRGQMPRDLSIALDQLQPGQLTQPLEVPGGLSIIKVVEVRADSTGGIDASDPELREQVRRRIAGQRSGRLAEGYLQELRRDALIEVR